MRETKSNRPLRSYESKGTVMGRYKLCGKKLVCKLRDAHEGDCDFGDTTEPKVNETEQLKQQVANLKSELARSTSDALTARVASAELELARVHAAVREMASGVNSAGMTILCSQLCSLLPERFCSKCNKSLHPLSKDTVCEGCAISNNEIQK